MPESPFQQLSGQHSFSPEFRLLVACSWIAPSEMERGQGQVIAALCSERIDWDEVIALIERHKVPVLAYYLISKFAGEFCPAIILDRLRKMNRQARMHALFHATELARLSKLFDDKGVKMIPLKGVVLSQYLYNEIAMRQSRDIDVLIRFEDIDLAVQLLEMEGYSCELSSLNITPRQQKHIRQTERHYVFRNDAKNICIELHWDCFLWQPKMVDKLWDHAKQVDWMGNKIYQFDDAALLLYLCEHGAMHKWFRLKWLGDVAALISRKPDLDWIYLEKLADEFGLKKVMHQTLVLLNMIYGFNVSAASRILESHEKSCASLASQALKSIQDSSYSIERTFEGLSRAKYLISLKPTISFVDIFKVALIAPGDFCTFSVKDKLFLLYVPLRPLFWAWRKIIKNC